MKLLALAVALLGLVEFSVFAEDASTNTPAKIPSAQAKKYIGTNGIVVGTVAEVNLAEKLVRLNFDKPYPGHTFTVVIWAANTNLFPDLSKLKGKTVEVSGKITDYRERPQIVLVNTNQLKVVEKVEEPEKK
jgi:DNA/RNA endonuclease YhcR with UshA esterase domain